MQPVIIQQWHQIVKEGDTAAIESLLADNVVFYSPVVHTPQEGKFLTNAYLTAANTVLGNDSFMYVREIVGERDAMLEFSVVIDDIVINGVDIIRWNDNNKITDFKVMLRPFKSD